MSKILYHYSPLKARASILAQGLSGEYDQANEGGVGMVYLIDRLGGEEEGRELWQTERESEQIPPGANDEELMAYFGAKRERDMAWSQSMRRALTRGDISGEEAKKRGFWNLEPGEWEKLPGILYHVTTNAEGVSRGGLKTRREQDTEIGVGLGGGNSNAVSFTEDIVIAEAIASGLREMHDVVNGKLSVADMLAAAGSGIGAKRPYLAEMMRGWVKDWVVGREWPDGVRAMLEGKAIERGKLGEPPDAEHEWTPMAAGGSNTSGVWTGGDGKIYANYYERAANEEEKVQDRVDMFKRFAAFREWAGGAYDPLFFGSDVRALGTLDKEKIQILQVQSAPGAQGYKMGAMGEWRTGSGEAVVVVGVVSAGKLKADSFPGDVWAVDVEGLELEEDLMWSGQGKSWMVEGEIGPERLTLLTADKAKLIPPGKECEGHDASEISALVKSVGDKWEASFKLWREIEPDSDVPRCRTLLGMADTGDGWPPEEVRALVGLSDKGEPISTTSWVSAPYEMLGAGEDRFGVALCAEHVLKIDPYWRSATEREVNTWAQASEELRAVLCPVLAGGEEGYYGWVVMPRCQTLEVVDDVARQAVAKVLGLGDLHDYNLGKLGDKVVILDYGTSDESGPIMLASERQIDQAAEVV